MPGKSEPRNRTERRHPELLDFESAAPLLLCTPRMVRKLVETRQIAHVKVGRLVRIEPEAIADYIDRHRVNAAS